MSSHLQQQIQTRMEAKKLSIYALEKQAGLKKNTAWQILHGVSKNPRTDSLKAIADVFECSVDDLIGPSENDSETAIAKTIIPLKGIHAWNEKLYVNITKLVSKSIATRKLDLKVEHVMALVYEAYKYSIAKSSSKADQDFVNWLLNNKNFK